mmetsp:Transcript_23912/g.45431  ORF Transcript_23912/g.45431 Transcript_23912/m.45431 type:complete len:215 (-) Transcript_23912:132-776(-)
MYTAYSYLIITFLLEIPMMFVLSVFAISVSAYGLGNYDGNHYIVFLCVYTAMLWSYECIARCSAVTYSNPLIGAMVYMNAWFAGLLFCGVMVPEEDIVWPIKVFMYLFPTRYSLSALLFINLQDKEYAGAVLDNSSKGFSCPGVIDNWCYGRTGKQVLESLGRTYKNFGPENNVVRDTCAMLAIGGFYKIVEILVVLRKVSAHRVVKRLDATIT